MSYRELSVGNNDFPETNVVALGPRSEFYDMLRAMPGLFERAVAEMGEAQHPASTPHHLNQEEL